MVRPFGPCAYIYAQETRNRGAKVTSEVRVTKTQNVGFGASEEVGGSWGGMEARRMFMRLYILHA